MSIFECRESYIPTRYPWAIDLFKRQTEFFWIPEEIPLGDDVREWKRNLTDSERETCTNIFRVFTRMDQLVMEHYLSDALSRIKAPEIQMMLAFFSGMEAVHVRAYAHLIQTLGLPDSIFTDFTKLDHMRKKCEFLKSFTSVKETPRDIIKTIACLSLFGEGVLLYGSFAVLSSFQSIGYLRSMAQLIQYSQRDEEIHVEAASRLIVTIAQENGIDLELDMGNVLRDCCRSVVELEKEFLHEMFTGNVRSIGIEETKKYVEHLGWVRLANIGVKPYMKAKENPLARLDAYIHGVEHVNFFEQRPMNYSKYSKSSDWQDAFEYGDRTGCD